MARLEVTDQQPQNFTQNSLTAYLGTKKYI